MSQENVEFLRAGYEAVSRGDWDALFRDMGPDFVLTTQRFGGPFRGRAEIQAMLEDQRAPFE